MFQKGVSGNPKGRPLGAKHKQLERVTALAGNYTKDALIVLAEILKDKDAPHQARVAAGRELLDRAVGKPAQAITGADGGALQLMSKVIHEHLVAVKPEPEQLEAETVDALPPASDSEQD